MIIKTILGICIVAFGLWVCDGTIWKEIVLLLMVLLAQRIWD